MKNYTVTFKKEYSDAVYSQNIYITLDEQELNLVNKEINSTLNYIKNKTQKTSGEMDFMSYIKTYTRGKNYLTLTGLRCFCSLFGMRGNLKLDRNTILFIK